MNAVALYGLAIGALGMVTTPHVNSGLFERTDPSSIVLVEKGPDIGKSGTGEYGKQGSKSDQPTSGKQSFGSDQPQSGDFSPNPSASTKTPDETLNKRGAKSTGKSASSEGQHGPDRDTGSSAGMGSIQISKDRPLQLSARNQFQGTITKIVEGQAMAEVSVKVGDLEMVAAITKGSVENLGLSVNDPVVVVVKSTDVMIGK